MTLKIARADTRGGLNLTAVVHIRHTNESAPESGALPKFNRSEPQAKPPLANTVPWGEGVHRVLLCEAIGRPLVPTTGEGWKLTHLQRRRGPHRRDVVLHRVLHLLEGAHLDLAHALPAEAEFLRQLRKRDLFLGEPARLEDAPLALIEHGERIGQRLAAVIELLARGERRLLVRGFVHQPVLPLAGIAVVADRGVERGVAAET